jgi:uncharacterized membrane protein YphA (DoxX/SURF4 family)
MVTLDFLISREIEGMTVAVTVAVALACAHTLCGIAPRVIMTTLAMTMIVLILHKNARTMPANYFISLGRLISNHIYINEL